MRKRLIRRTVALSMAAVLVLVLCVGLFPATGPSSQPASHGLESLEEESSTSEVLVAEDESDGTADDAETEYELEQEFDPEPEWEPEDDPEPEYEDDSPNEEQGPVVFTMPQGMEYEPNVALVKIDESMPLDDVSAELSSIDGVLPLQIGAEDVACGYVEVSLAQGVSVEDAVNQLMGCGAVEAAQPNYVYKASELIEGDELSVENTDDEEVGDVESPEVDELEDVGEAEQAPAQEDEPTQDLAAEPDADAEEEDYDVAASDDAGTAIEEPEEEAEDEALSNDQSEQVAEGLVPEEQQVEDAEEAASELEVDSADDESVEDGEDATDEAIEAEATAVTINDTLKGNQWGLSSIRAYEAWALSKSDKKVSVAVMDVGFNVNHPDLKNNIAKDSSGVVGYNASGLAGLEPTSTDTDTRNHGTHVAGIISGVTNNGVGVSGASYNARIIPVMVADNKAEVYTNYFVTAFDWIKSNQSTYNIRVVNISLGPATTTEVDTAVRDGIKELWDAGIVVVASAGNLSSSQTTAYKHYPSDYPYCVGVMSLTQSGSTVARSTFSNYNVSASDVKHICAPGNGIYSTLYSGDYGYMSGTSMAAPFVSSTLALMFAAKPSLSPADAVNYLYSTATDLGTQGWDIYYGYGEVNAYYAVYATLKGLSAAQSARTSEQVALAQEQAKAQEQATTQTTTTQSQTQTTTTTQTQAQRDAAAAASVRYRSRLRSSGWQAWKAAGATSGSASSAKRPESLSIKLQAAPYSGGITYRVRGDGYGWQAWKSDGAAGGTSGKWLEAVEVRLTGEMASRYDVWYRVRCSGYGWLSWASNGAAAGTAGTGRRLTAVQVRVLPKGSAAPGATTTPYVPNMLRARARGQGYGWQAWRSGDSKAGKAGKGKRMEGLRLKLKSKPFSGGISYRARGQGYGWQKWKKNGATAGASGKRMGAVQIKLTGEMAKHYDVWYRAYCQGYGWMGWTKNGKSAGTSGKSKRLEAVQVCIRPKGSSAPGSTSKPYRK